MFRRATGALASPGHLSVVGLLQLGETWGGCQFFNLSETRQYVCRGRTRFGWLVETLLNERP